MKFQSTLLQHSSTDILVNTLRRIRNPRTYRRGYACGLKENANKGLFYSCFGLTHPGKTKRQKPTQALKNASK